MTKYIIIKRLEYIIKKLKEGFSLYDMLPIAEDIVKQIKDNS